VQLPATVLNSLHRLKHSCSNRNSSAPGTDPGSNHLLRETEIVSTHAIVNHQKPAAEPLHDRVPRIADAALRHLCNQLSITLEQGFKCNFVLDK
jgi:hypothetical protein